MLNKHLVEKMLPGSEFKSFEITDSSSPYPQGQCTWYVYERVQQFGKKVGSDWEMPITGIIVQKVITMMSVKHRLHIAQ